MPTRISLMNKIIINAPRQVVFDYIIDLRNDPKWRTEVKRMDVQGPCEVGSVAVEYSTLFGRLMKTVTPTILKIIEEPRKVVFSTPEDHHQWLESYREVKSLGDGRTEMTYCLSFDVPPSGIFGAIYAKILSSLYQPRLPKYLKLLKNQIESKPALK